MERAKVTMIACMSLDGYISRGNGNAPNQEKYGGWTSREDKELFWKFVADTDVVLAGRRALEEMPRLNKPVVMLSRNSQVPLTGKAAEDLVRVVDPYPSCLHRLLDKLRGRKILLCGGAMSYDFMLRWNLVDKIVLVLEPILLRSGVRLTVPPRFNGGQEENKFNVLKHEVLNKRGSMRIDLRRTVSWTQ